MDKLISYAMTFIGVPYRWGGDDPMEGYDCSGFVQELLMSVGVDPIGDQTSHMLYRYFCAKGKKINEIKTGALVFYGSETKITHVALAIDSFRIIEAAGGGSKTKNEKIAARQNAFIRIRPARRRKDLQAIIMPKYPRQLKIDRDVIVS